MTAKNDVTGDKLVSKLTTDAFRDNFDRIFGKKDPEQVIVGAVAESIGLHLDSDMQKETPPKRGEDDAREETNGGG